VHALAQCRGYLHGLDVTIEQTTPRHKPPRGRAVQRTVGAVASTLAGELFGLVALATDIEDHPDNATRFVVVARERVAGATVTTEQPLSASRSTVRLALRILGRFAARDITLRIGEPADEARTGRLLLRDRVRRSRRDDVVADCLADLQTTSLA